MGEEPFTINGMPVADFEGEKQKVLNAVIEVFSNVAAQFENRDGVDLRDYYKLLQDPSRSLDGSELGQKPEAFTNQFLTHPLLY